VSHSHENIEPGHEHAGGTLPRATYEHPALGPRVDQLPPLPDEVIYRIASILQQHNEEQARRESISVAPQSPPARQPRDHMADSQLTPLLTVIDVQRLIKCGQRQAYAVVHAAGPLKVGPSLRLRPQDLVAYQERLRRGTDDVK
jgi:hypothetical protein